MKKLAFHISDKSIFVFDPATGKTQTVLDGNKRFLLIRKAFIEGDTELAMSLLDMKETVEKSSGGDFTVKNGQVTFNGFVLNEVISNKLVRLIVDGARDCTPIKNYVKRILKNPSSQSANELYDFLGYRELPITEDGMVLAWKGVNDDFWSVRGNGNTKVIRGKVDNMGRIWNGVGETIEVERLCVDDNRHNECSHGLHVGSYDYASRWGSKLLLVEFDPADAVSVPTDCQFQKLRVCKYRVVAEMDKEISAPIVTKDELENISTNRNGVQFTMSLYDAIEDAVDNYYFDPERDKAQIVQFVQEETGATKAEATDALVEWMDEYYVPEQEGNFDEDDDEDEDDDQKPNGDFEDRIFDYLKKVGHASVKRIQSMLHTKGVTCKDIDELLALCPWAVLWKGSNSISQKEYRIKPRAAVR